MSYQGYIYKEIPGSVGLYPSQRKMKRTVPDSDKDERYWEKRKRNNMAAKKSRENKRMADAEMRKTVLLLEQENALLKKEVALLKAQIGIPDSHSVLTAEQRSECLQQVTHMNYTDDLKKEIDDDAPSPGCNADDTHCETYICDNVKNQKSYEEGNDETPEMKDYNCSMKRMSQHLSLYNPLNTMFWTGHVKYPSKNTCNRDIYAGANFPYLLPYPANRCSKTCDSEESSTTIEHGNGNKKVYTGYYNYVNDVTSENITSPYIEDLHKQHGDDVLKENQDLKRKLFLLSSQFQEMKNIACVD